MKIKKIIEDRDNLQKQVNLLTEQLFKYFNYQPGWTELSLEDHTQDYWFEDGNQVFYGSKPLTKETDPDFSGTLFRNGANTAVYRKEDYVLISVDTQCGHNQYLMLFDASKEDLKGKEIYNDREYDYDDSLEEDDYDD